MLSLEFPSHLRFPSFPPSHNYSFIHSFKSYTLHFMPPPLSSCFAVSTSTFLLILSSVLPSILPLLFTHSFFILNLIHFFFFSFSFILVYSSMLFTQPQIHINHFSFIHPLIHLSSRHTHTSFLISNSTLYSSIHYIYSTHKLTPTTHLRPSTPAVTHPSTHSSTPTSPPVSDRSCGLSISTPKLSMVTNLKSFFTLRRG